MESKVCSKCKELLSVDNFGIRYRKLKSGIINSYLRCSCKNCIKIYKKNYDKKNNKIINEKQRNYRKKNNQQHNEKQRKYRLENRIKISEYEKKYALKYPEKIKIRMKKTSEKAIKELSDRYVINKITRDTNLSSDTIKQYPELIEAKRLQILTKRLCRTSQN